MDNKKYTFFTTVSPSLEGLLASELETFGAMDIIQGRGSVSFKGELEAGYQVLLWTRLANRVLMQLKEFPCTSREELYDAIHTFPWDQHFSPDKTFTIKTDLVFSELANTTYVSQVTKDAIVDYFRQKTGIRPSIDNQEPDLRLHLYIESNKAILSLDISGTSLHQRAYRVKNVKASLKENLAAAILLRAHWPKWAAKQETFVDPLCGSGTFAIEAAMIAADIAPGLLHPVLGSPVWYGHDQEIWQKLIGEAQERKLVGLKNIPAIYALDKDREAVYAANTNVKQAGLSDYIQVFQSDIRKIGKLPITKTSHGLVALNPPYGKRLRAAEGEDQNLQDFYKELGQILFANFPGWDVVMLTSSENLTKSTGLRAHKINNLYNGPIKCITAYFYLKEERVFKGKNVKSRDEEDISDHEQEEDTHEAHPLLKRNDNTEQKLKSGPKKIILKKVNKTEIEELTNMDMDMDGTISSEPDRNQDQIGQDQIGQEQAKAEMFVNRLKRNLKMFKTWRKKENISCYRLYDKDIPEFAAAIDIYEGKWLHVQEYVAPSIISPQKAAARLKILLDCLPETLNVEKEDIFVKERLKQRGRLQYNKIAEKKDFKLINEGGHKFYTNFTDYLDVGIFLDHRPTRSLIKKLANGKRFLNLYCYTATATVYAAKGGALTTTSIDTSNTYLQWAEKNFLANGLNLDDNVLNCSDCLEWLTHYARDMKQPFDLIFIDPPTFSNNKTKKRMFDIQKDYGTLLCLAAAILAKNGTIIFSTNFRKFEMEPDLLPELKIEDITKDTISPDFQRNKRIHYCWQITKITK